VVEVGGWRGDNYTIPRAVCIPANTVPVHCIPAILYHYTAMVYSTSALYEFTVPVGRALYQYTVYQLYCTTILQCVPWYMVQLQTLHHSVVYVC